MSTPIFPDLPGLAWPATRSPQWNTLVQSTAGGADARLALAFLPTWAWELSFNYLKLGSGFLDMQRLAGFYNAVAGGAFSFFFRDQDDCSTRGEFIANGDGTTRVFQLQRDWGGFAEPVQGIDVRALGTYGPYTRPAAVTFQVYVNASPVSVTKDNETGIITFSGAPSNGSVITADFSYLWRCRFAEDKIDFGRLWNQVYEMKSLKLEQVRA